MRYLSHTLKHQQEATIKTTDPSTEVQADNYVQFSN